jgi:hypothetical protein
MNRDKIEEILNSLGSEEIPADLHKIAEDASTDFCRTLTQSRQKRKHLLLEYIMRSKLPKLAAAAVIVFAVIIGLSYFDGTSSIALAEVLERVEQVRAFAYKMKMKIRDMPAMPEGKEINIDMEATVAKDIGMRVAARADGKLVSDTYIVMDEGVSISLMPEAKKYVRMTLTDDLLEKMQKDNGDPRAMLKEFTSNEHTPLGRSVVDGIEVEGFESTDPNIVANVLGSVLGRIWVDVETRLPIRYDIEVLDKHGEITMEMTVSGFEWDIDVDPGDLTVQIPDDYELMADVQMSADEKGIVEGLSLFAEFAGGKYPSELNMMTVMQEFQSAMIAKLGGARDKLDGPKEQEVMQKLVNLQMAGAFYTTLASEGKDPAYYGDKVTAEFPDAVLMRWKLEDGGYKIIFGNLTIGEATPEELEELESAPLNGEPIAIKPRPADGTEGVPLTGLKLSWMPGAYVTNHTVYFGTDAEQLALLGEVTTDYAEPGQLQRNTTYYWRVDEVQADGSIATGQTWSFNTGRLVGWWKLDDGSGDAASDSSGNGHDGVLAGNANWAEGVAGGALAFDGDGDYVDAGKDPAFDVTGQITVAAWIKVDAFDKQWQAIVAKGDSAWRLQRNGGKSTLEFACSGLVVPGTMWGDVHGSVDVNDGQWHHAAGVYDGAKVCLYVDGTLDASKEASGAIRSNDQPVCIGQNSEKPKRWWNGLIDDVRIYSYGLTADEVAAICDEAASTSP